MAGKTHFIAQLVVDLSHADGAVMTIGGLELFDSVDSYTDRLVSVAIEAAQDSEIDFCEPADLESASALVRRANVECPSAAISHGPLPRRILTWYYLCRGPNAAKASKTMIEPKESRVDPSVFAIGDVFEFGTIHSGSRRRRSWRRRYVVLEVAADRLVVAEMPTLAQALRLGNAAKDRAARSPDLFLRRREAWEDVTRERSSAEVLDDEAIEVVFR